jgi:hypothetical protein
MSKRKKGLASGPVRVTPQLREAMIERCMTQPDAKLLIEMLGLNGEWDEAVEDLEDEAEEEDLAT